MKAETIKDRLRIDLETANKVLGVIRGEIEPMEFTSVQKWVDQCYNMPSKRELKLEAINEIIGGFGTEAIFGEHITIPDVAYVNMGDTYADTICMDYCRDKWVVCSWGDLVEKYGYGDNA